MCRVKVKENIDDIQFVKDYGISTEIIYNVSKKDNGTYELKGFEFEEEELIFIK